MSDVAIKVANLGKKYSLGGHKSGSFRESMTRLFNRSRPPSSVSGAEVSPGFGSEFWALQDINFEIKRGEAVGIIGRNGAGKSTLLKILSRITEPTRGRFEVFGRVSSLLEVGTGFHPELTGRENVYLNGTILGMKRREVKAKFDEIVAFSGVEKFIDTPVKHYSSGMQVRLAFAVAAHLEPEILIIDEVLAVGDAEFQKKCLGKMEDVTGEGRTVLFVSHNMGVIKKLCSDGIYLKNGFLHSQGNVDRIVEEYVTIDSSIHSFFNKYLFESERVIAKNIEIQDENQKVRGSFSNLEQVHIKVNLSLSEDIDNFKAGIEVEDQFGVIVISSFHNDKSENYNSNILDKGDFSLCTIIPKAIFNEGIFYVNILLGVHQVKWIYRLERVAKFKIDFTIQNTNFSANKRNSLFAPMLDWKIQKYA